MNLRLSVFCFTALVCFSNSGLMIAQEPSLRPAEPTFRPVEPSFRPVEQQLPSPECLSTQGPHDHRLPTCPEYTHALWLKGLRLWKTERLIRVGYDGDRYANAVTAWTQSSFIQPQMMVQDRYFYDPVRGKYTVDRYLDDLQKRYGGIDAVLIWPTYPNMGIDDRNQLDMIRSMPGGLEGVRQVVADFHHRGVRVMFPMMMWDQGTHDPGTPWPDAIAGVMKEIDADGINGDTQDGVPLSFSLASDKIHHPLAFEPELGPSDEALGWNLMTWGQYRFPFVPEVDKFKWLEPRHMVNVSDRWARNKTDDLQFAFFNGVGWESWENIWGIWNGITDRDAEATRRVVTIERAVAPFFLSSDWEPLYPTRPYGVFASRWPIGGDTVWTIVNRNEYDVNEEQMTVPVESGIHYYDLYHGVELKPVVTGTRAKLSFAIEAHGFGAIFATHSALSEKMQALIAMMKSMTDKPLAIYSSEWKVLPQTLIVINSTKPAATTPDGMVKIPGADFTFEVNGIEIEGSDDTGLDVQYPWENSARRYHEHFMHLKSFYIDKYPVTNAEYKKFVDSGIYHPKDTLNYLRDWKDGSYQSGWADKPVTWVSLEDARAYAAWAGKRLPHEWEWQYAAQGTDDRVYPWGNLWLASAVPVPNQTRTLSSPDLVSAHPAGASPFGVMDMVGNVWQWTDEYQDDHTRAGILRGGSYYQPQGSIWYFPQAYRNDQHGKLLLMAPSDDRSGTLGFRCVKDGE
jgi:iron(II)-dependent oxidoreductase